MLFHLPPVTDIYLSGIQWNVKKSDKSSAKLSHEMIRKHQNASFTVLLMCFADVHVLSFAYLYIYLDMMQHLSSRQI